jgi:hypothetical protein
MPDVAGEIETLVRLLLDPPKGTPDEGLSIREMAAILKWPTGRVNDRLVALGGRVRHQKKRIKQETAIRYKLNR